MIPRSILLISCLVALSLLGDSMLYAVLPVKREALGLQVWQLGVLLSINRYVRLLSNSFAGRICDRYGRRRPFVIVMFAAALITASYGICFEFWQLLISRMLWGVCWSFIRLEGLNTVSDAGTSDKRGRYMGFFQSISRAGSAIGTFIGALLTDCIGFGRTLVIFGGVTGLGAVVSLFRSPTSSLRASKESASERVLTPSLPRRRKVYALEFTGFCVYFIAGVMVATLGHLLLTRFGEEVNLGWYLLPVATTTGLLVSMRWIFDLTLAPYLGHLSDKYGRRMMVNAGLSLSAAMLLVLSFTADIMYIAMATLLFFLAVTGTLTVLYAAVSETATAHTRNKVMSRFVTFTDFGSASGPLIAYQMLAIFSLAGMYLSSVAICLGAIFVYNRLGQDEE